MAIYTLSINYIDGVKDNKSHLLSVFYQFANPDTEHKAAMDKSKKLLNHYAVSAQTNSDFLIWLDLMSRKPQSFEVIDIIIPEETSEEEMYLKIAAATKPSKSIIVGSHQFWKKFCYVGQCNKIQYNNFDIRILDKDEAFKELNSKSTNLTIMPQKNNPWASGSFYITLAIILIFCIAAVAKFIHWTIFPFVVIGAALLLSMVGALQLKNDDKLKETNFIRLMLESLKRLPLLNYQSKKNEEKSDSPDSKQ